MRISDVAKVWVWAFASLLIALGLTPLAFNAGKAMAELSPVKNFNSVLDRVAAWSGAADLEDFFTVLWIPSASLLLLPLIEWLQCTQSRGSTDVAAVAEAFPTVAKEGFRFEIASNPLVQGLAGFAITFGCFSLIGLGLVKAGEYSWIENAGGWTTKLFLRTFSMLIVVVAAEAFYRCIMLKVFGSAKGAAAAIVMAGMMFGGINYVLGGFGKTHVLEAEALSGLGLIGVIFYPADFFHRLIVFFVPWFTFGCILAWTRWRTASAWLPGGLLLGWMLSGYLFTRTSRAFPSEAPTTSFLVANSLHDGLISMLGAIVVGVLVFHLIRRRSHEQQS